MKSIILLTVTLALNAWAYHDPDLNYHISQVQKLDGCDHGYSYPTPAVQLTTAGIKTAVPLAPPVYTAPSYLPPRNTYATGLAYQAPKITYSQPASSYQAVVSHGSYSTGSSYAQTQTEQKEIHGYATSAGLSTAASPPRTVIPQATYAQAPIIAKITAAPLIAKFATSPAKTTYVAQVSQQSGSSLAKTSLNSYSVSGGPVVTQLYAAAPAAKYATSPALRVQPVQQLIPPARYTAISSGTQYGSSHAISGLTPVAQVPLQYRGPAVTYATSVSHAAPSLQYSAPVKYAAPQVATQFTTQHSAQQYFAPAVNQYAKVVATQYAAPAVSHYAAPAAQYVAPAAQYAAPVSHYSAPVVSQYAKSGVAAVSQYAAPAHVAAPSVAVAAPGHIVGGHKVKNVHTDFIENYDHHPRYAYEYTVNDPHTGDIKHQKEERDGEVVKGQYSLVEPDGSVRTVNYVADWETGFHADVRNSKDNQH